MSATPASWCNDDELDVRHYLDAPALAAGMRSNLGPQLEALALARPHVDASCTDPEAAMVARFENAARAARVHRVLQACGPRAAEILLAAFGDEQLPREDRLRFGDVLGAVVRLLEQRGELDRRRAGDRGASELAERRLHEAKAAYAAAKAAS